MEIAVSNCLRKFVECAMVPRYWMIVYSNASESIELNGGGKPWSRPHHWRWTTVPITLSSGIGLPPSVPRAKAFMSIEKLPEQSVAGAGFPPELMPGVRRTGGMVHRTPPWKGMLLRPVMGRRRLGKWRANDE